MTYQNYTTVNINLLRGTFNLFLDKESDVIPNYVITWCAHFKGNKT